MFRKPASLAVWTFAAALAYAVARYHVAGSVPWREFPVYVTNKAVSLTALAFLAFSYRAGKTGWVPAGAGRFFGIWGFTLLNAHVALTALVWDDRHFGKLFAGGAPSQVSNLSMALGAMALVFFCAPMWATARDPDWRWWRPMQSAGYWGLAMTAIHTGMIGWQGWLAPSSWPGHLPPITMISVALALWPVLARRFK